LPIYRHFYVERHTTDGWVVPPGFDPEPWTFESDRPFGGFAWAHPQAKWLELFWGAEALFPMRSGPPEDRRGSALLQYLDQFYDYAHNEAQLCWLPYPDLVIDLWKSAQVTVEAKAPARYALLFGDGRQTFPEAALLETGASQEELDRLGQGWLTREPVDTTFGRQRFRLAELPPDQLVEVTWRVTLAEFIEEPHSGLFEGLRRYGLDEELRILSRRG
jgi:hypothetical protein